MINKKIIFTGLIILFLLASGCADKKQDVSDDSIEDSHIVAEKVIETSIGTNKTINATGEIAKENATNTSDKTDSISPEDLEKLKDELEDMEFIDLSGLSEL